MSVSLSLSASLAVSRPLAFVPFCATITKTQHHRELQPE